MNQCKIDGCARISHARGWCAMHYERWRTTGDLGPADPEPTNSNVALYELGISYRQFDYWVRKGYVKPTTSLVGSGHRRILSDAELFALAEVARSSREIDRLTERLRSGVVWDDALAAFEVSSAVAS